MKQDRLLLKASMIGFAVLSLSFWLMMPMPGDTESRPMDILAGICFWIGLITGAACQTALSIRRKKWEKKTGLEIPGRMGLVSFCRNPKGKLADLLFMVSILGLGLGMWLTQSRGIICFIFLGFTVLAFSGHCVYNGKNYNYLQIRRRMKPGRRARQRGIQDEKQQNHT